ncbi:MAG: hypothetical protein IJ572_04170 [Bacilli bacterium]|nr:hypothetical protein [Bacilli bacterium]
MNNCPKCGALNAIDAQKCNMCGTTLSTVHPDLYVAKNSSINLDNAPIDYEKIKKEEELKKFNEELEQNNNPNNIDYNKTEYKNYSTEHYQNYAVYILILIIVLIAGAIFFAYKNNLFTLTNHNQEILNQVKNNANDYIKLLENYMSFSIKNSGLQEKIQYQIKGREYTYLPMPESGQCNYKDSVWTGSEGFGSSCKEFMSDISDNRCRDGSWYDSEKNGTICNRYDLKDHSCWLNNSITCYFPTEAQIVFSKEGKVIGDTYVIFDTIKCSKKTNNSDFECIELE